MTDTPALLVAGMGLSFMGLELVTTALHESTSRTIRALMKRSTRSTATCAVIGIAAGALLQSTSAVATVLGSTTSIGMTTLRQAVPIVAFANVGTTILVFASAFDIRIAVLLAVGISGIAFSMAPDFRWKAIASIVLGLALLLHGSGLMGTAAADVQSAGWFASFLRTWHDSAAMAFALGCVASFLTQATTPIALMTIVVANAGLIDGPPALVMIYGANLGSTLIRMLLTQRAAGAPRQVSRFQDLFKTVGTVVFVGLFAAEQGLNLPGMFAAISHLPAGLPVQLATANLAFNGSLALLASLLIRPIERFVARTWPSDSGEDLGAPMYALPEAVADAATATDLLDKEQVRMLKGIGEYLALARSGSALDPSAVTRLHRNFARLFREVEQFQIALVSKQFDEPTSARLGNMQGRQKVVELLEESVHQLALTLKERVQDGAIKPFLENIVEALDFLLLHAHDAGSANDVERIDLLFNLSGDRSEMMSSARRLYLAPERSLGAAERAQLLRVTTLFERIVWMVHQYAELLLRNVDRQEGTPTAA